MRYRQGRICLGAPGSADRPLPHSYYDVMRVIRYFVLWLARSFQAVGSLFSRFTDLFNGLLPALFSPPELTRLLQKHYARLYSDRFVKEPHDLIDYLERWETEVLDRYKTSILPEVILYRSSTSVSHRSR